MKSCSVANLTSVSVHTRSVIGWSIFIGGITMNSPSRDELKNLEAFAKGLMDGIMSSSFSMRAQVTLVLNGRTYCKKGEIIQVIEKDKKHTMFERYEEQRDSKGDKTIVGRMFKVSNDLVGLYFN